MYPPNLADQFLQNNETATAVFFWYFFDKKHAFWKISTEKFAYLKKKQ